MASTLSDEDTDFGVGAVTVAYIAVETEKTIVLACTHDQLKPLTSMKFQFSPVPSVSNS